MGKPYQHQGQKDYAGDGVMGATRDLDGFVKEVLTEEKWFDLCDSFEAIVVLLGKGLGGAEDAEVALRYKLRDLVGRLNRRELDLFENLLERETAFKTTLLTALQDARKANETKVS